MFRNGGVVLQGLFPILISALWAMLVFAVATFALELVAASLLWISILKLAGSAEIAIVNLFMKDTRVKRVICCICHFYLIFKVGLILFSALPLGATMRFPYLAFIQCPHQDSSPQI